MASREERMQQRLRGAQRRQVKDVDFGLVFPAPTSAHAPAAVPDVSIAQTASGPEPSSLESSRISSRPVAHTKPNTASPTENPPTISHSTVDANTSAKRRKLDTDSTPFSSTRSTRRPDIYALEDDQQDETLLDMLLDTTNDSIPREFATPSVVEHPGVASAPATLSKIMAPLLPVQVVDEVIESPEDAPGSGHLFRAGGIGTDSSSRLDPIQDESTFGTDLASPTLQNKRKRSNSRPHASPKRLRQSRHAQILADSSLELDELSPEQPSRGRPVATKEWEIRKPRDQSRLRPTDDEEAEAIGDEQAASILIRNKGRRISRGVTMNTNVDDDPAPSPAPRKRRGRHRIDSSPVRQRQPKQITSKAKPVKTAKKIRLGSPIPVTVHRFTVPLVYNDEEENADILNLEIPHTKRAGVNAIDVLMEISGEIVSSAMQTLDDGSEACEDATLRREYDTKRKAVVGFGTELQTRLLEHTINLDNGYSLEKRLREEQKRKLKLRDEILHVRAERERLALRMDEVRINHENEKRIALDEESLNTNIHDIELAIDLGKQQQAVDIDQATGIVGAEVLLKRVAEEASNRSNPGGLLKRIKDFNTFLERAALALESRKV